MGVRQHLLMDRYGWNITIYYTVDKNQRKEVVEKLKEMGCTGATLESATKNIEKAGEDTGFTYSNFDKKCSLVVIHKASSVGEFINTFEHEKNHLEMHICEALDINPYSERAAHLSGNLAQLIIEEALYSIVEL